MAIMKIRNGTCKHARPSLCDGTGRHLTWVFCSLTTMLGMRLVLPGREEQDLHCNPARKGFKEGTRERRKERERENKKDLHLVEVLPVSQNS